MSRVPIKNSRGFMLAAALVSLFILQASIYASIKYNQSQASSRSSSLISQTKQGMSVVRDFLVQNSADADNDGHYELPQEGAGNAVPGTIPVNKADAWGSGYLYCTWDLGSPNSNPAYSQNNIAPPIAGLIGRLVSAGPDKILQTGCSDTTVKGDDIVLDIYEANVNYSNASLGGWQAPQGMNYIQLLNAADYVGIGTSEAAPPTHKLELPDATTPIGGLALGDVEVFRSAPNAIQINGGGTLTSANEAVTIGVADASVGAWIRNDGTNANVSTNVGDLYLGFAGNPAKTIRIGNSTLGSVQIAGSAPSGSFVVDGTGAVTVGGLLKVPTGIQVSGVASIDSNGNITGQGLAGSTLTLSGGTLSMTNGTSNMVVMGAGGLGSPSFVTRSAGTKIVLSPTLGASSADYAFGVEGNALWQSVNLPTSSFKWYGGTSNAMTLDGGGHLALGTAPNALYSLNTVGTINAAGFYVNGVLLTPGGMTAGTVAGQTAYWDGSQWSPTSGLMYIAGTGSLNVSGGVSASAINLTGASNQIQFAGVGGGSGIFTWSPTASPKTITFPDVTGTVVTTGNLSSINTVGTITSGIWNGSPIGVNYGGTGITGGYTAGDILYASGASTLAKLADVATGNVLISGGVGVAPLYGKVDLTAHVTNALPVANGGTNIGSYTVGAILYASAATTLTQRLDVATGNVLISGGVNTAPTYGKVGLTTHVSGTLPIANGGTNSTVVPTLGGIVYGTGTAYAVTAAGGAGYLLVGAGASSQPVWTSPSSFLTTDNYGNLHAGTNSLNSSNGLVGSNIAIGNGAMQAASGSSNIVSSNIGIGNQALNALIAGSSASTGNTAIGFNTLVKATTGGSNTAIGNLAGYGLSPPDGNGNNTAIGAGSMYGSATFSNNIGTSNTAIGAQSLAGISSGASNVALGSSALNGLTTGSSNVAVGPGSLSGATSSSYSIAMGYNANRNFDNIGSAYNIAIGYFSLNGYSTTQINNTATNNIALGTQSGYGSGTGNTGPENIMIGHSAAYNISSGANNSLLGSNSGFGLTTGSNNLFLGYYAGYYENTNGSQIILDVMDRTSQSLQRSNAPIYIVANSTVASQTIHLAGVVTISNGLTVSNIGTGSLTATAGVFSTSDERFKKDVVSLNQNGDILDRIRMVNGVYYHWRDKEFPSRQFATTRQIGVIAQNIERVFPEIVTTGADGYKAVAYDKLGAILLEGMKAQQSQLDNHEARIQKAEMDVATIRDKEIVELREENNSLRTKISSLEKWITSWIQPGQQTENTTTVH